MSRAFQIQTTYYGMRNEVVQINLALHAKSAVLRAVSHMQDNTYGASTCEVFDTQTSELHAAIHHAVNGVITIQYVRRSTRPEHGPVYHDS